MHVVSGIKAFKSRNLILGKCVILGRSLCMLYGVSLFPTWLWG